MIPETVVGVVVFIAGAGPGYLFVQLAERYGPRRDRSTLEEAAELLVVGSLATAVSFLLAVGIVGIDATAVSEDPGRYALDHPWRLLALLTITIAFSYGGVWLLTTRLLYGGKRREVEPGGSMWYAAFKRLVPAEHGTLVTVERKDGSAVSGLLGSATADESEHRDLLIIPPENRDIYSRATRDGPAVALQESFVIVRGEDIDLIAGRYLPVTPAEPPLERKWRLRWPITRS